jgi:hypothetical protein
MRCALTDQQQADFDNRGFLVVPQALSEPDVKNLNSVVDEIYKCYGGDHDSGRLEVRNCVAHDQQLLDLTANPKLLPMVVDLLGPNIKIRSSHLDVRPPLPLDSIANDLGKDRWGEPEQWHVDGPLYGYPAIYGQLPMMEVKVGYYLTDVTQPDSGALCVIPGSHRSDYRLLALDGLQIPPDSVYRVHVPAGSAILFRTGLWHCVSPNLSMNTRKVLYYAYTYRWIHPSDYLVQSQELLSRCSPLERQLLGATATDHRNPLGSEPERTPCSFYWYSEKEDLPLLEYCERAEKVQQESACTPSISAVVPYP